MPAWMSTTGAVLGYVLFFAVSVAGVAIIPLGVPGQFAIVLATLVLILIAGPQVVSWWVFAALLGLAVGAELLEALAGFFGAKRARGSVRVALAGVAGGIVGAIVGSVFAPVVGSLLGAFAGTFGGAFAAEYHRNRTCQGAAHVATGALVGRMVGSLIKVVVGLLMIALVAAVLVRHWMS